MISISRQQVIAATNDALIIINDGAEEAIVLERIEGGGIDDERLKPGCNILHVDFAKEAIDQQSFSIHAGDWCVVPFVKCCGEKIESEADYYSFVLIFVD